MALQFGLFAKDNVVFILVYYPVYGKATPHLISDWKSGKEVHYETALECG